MKKILVWTILVFLCACDSNSTLEKSKTLKYFEDNWWYYDWEKADDRLTLELMNECINIYNQQTSNTDRLILTRVYRGNFNSHSYLLIRFKFKEKMDLRVVFVYSEEEKEIIGYFEQSLA